MPLMSPNPGSEPDDAACPDDTAAEPVGPLEEPEFEEVDL